MFDFDFFEGSTFNPLWIALNFLIMPGLMDCTPSHSLSAWQLAKGNR